MLATVNFRSGGSYFTAIDDRHTPETLAQRMTGGGFVICEDSRWGKHRIILVNLSDVQSVVLEPSNTSLQETAGTSHQNSDSHQPEDLSDKAVGSPSRA